MAEPLHVAMVGYGEQARRFYHRVLEELSDRIPLRLSLIVDLEDRADAVRRVLEQHTIQPDRLELLPAEFRRERRLSPRIETLLGELHDQGRLDRLLVITEPKAHKPYVMWGARHSVDVLCEKPLTAIEGLAEGDESLAWRLYTDYLDITGAIRDGRIVLMAPRRLHEGFRTLTDYLREFLATYQVPVTSVEYSHGEGVWTMPGEFETRENHPFRYGYGKLLHSGYHGVELVSRLAMLNAALPAGGPETLEIYSQDTRPYDFFGQVDAAAYRRLLDTDRFDELLSRPREASQHFGETDVQAIGQFRRDGRVLTNLRLALSHTSVNTRHWVDLPPDLRQNGRRLRERLTVQVAHLLSLETSSRYTPTEQLDEANSFELRAVRNTGVVGGEPYEIIKLGSSNASLMAERARREIVEAWLTGAPVDTDIIDQDTAVRMLAAVHAGLAARRAGRDGLIRVPVSTPFRP